MSIFTQTAAQTINQHDTMLGKTPNAQTRQSQTRQNQQAAQNQQAQRQSQAMQTNSLTFTQAENNPVFCFFYSYPPSCTHFNQRSEEIMNHAHKGGARI